MSFYIFVAGSYIFVGTIFELFGIQAVTERGSPISLPDRIEGLKHTSGAKFFDEKQKGVFPTDDFFLSCEADKFGFVLRVEKDADGLLTSKKINIY